MDSARILVLLSCALLWTHRSAGAANPTSIPSGEPQVAAPISPGSQLTLKEAIQIALKYHPRLQEAADNTSAAKQQIGQARSYLGPQLFGATQYLRSTDNGIGNTSYYNPDGAFPRISGTNHNLSANDTSQSWDTSNNYMGGVMLSQFLADFGRRHGFVSERQFEAAAAAAKGVKVFRAARRRIFHQQPLERSHWLKSEICVLLPEPSIPSTTMSLPR